MKLLNYKFYQNDNYRELKNGLSFLLKGDQSKKRWGTGSKFAELNYGAEFFRNYLFDLNAVGKEKNLLRRLFLFKEVYNKIGKKSSLYRIN